MKFNGEAFFAHFSVVGQCAVRKTVPFQCAMFFDCVNDSSSVQGPEAQMSDGDANCRALLDWSARPKHFEPRYVKHPPLLDRLFTRPNAARPSPN
jgi:hypothetical protein